MSNLMRPIRHWSEQLRSLGPTMRYALAILVSLGLFGGMASQSRAEDETRQSEITAAQSSARDDLFADIEAESITPSVSVGTLIERTHGQERLRAVLAQAQQIGGPRWIDEQTCQVRLDVQGAAVALALEQIASDNPHLSPVSALIISHNLKDWGGRVFSATGTSTARLEAIRPPPQSVAWKGASDADVRQAINAARQDAVTKVLDSLRAAPLADHRTVGDALANPSIREAMFGWLVMRPITQVDFREDRQVEVALSVTPREVYGRLRMELTRHGDPGAPLDEAGWQALANSINNDMAPAVGRAGVAMATQPVEMTVLPAQAPAWTERQLDAAASASGDNQLQAARAAEDAATAALKKQVLDLPLGKGQTLRSAAARDPAFANAIDRAMERSAHVYSVDYEGNNRVKVRESLDLRDFWEGMVNRG